MKIKADISYIKLLLQHFELKKTHKAPKVRFRSQESKDYKKLAELPDYLLKDIGVKRADINLKLNKPFWWS